MIDHSSELEHLKDAKPGSVRDVCALYEIAAMWLRGGDPLHPEHARWLADRLDGIANAIGSGVKGKYPDLLNATWAVSGKPGRKQRGSMEHAKRKIAVMHYHYLELTANLSRDERICLVAEGSLLTEDQVADAWKNRGKEFPELFPVTGS